MKYLIFGTGDYYERYKKWFNNDEITALLDNSPQKAGTYIDGIQVLTPEDGVKLEFDVIVILSFYVKAMKQQLMGLGVDEEKIYHFYDLHRFIDRAGRKKEIVYFGAQKEEALSDKAHKVLLLSQDMTLGGPAIALYHAAEILIKNGYQVIWGTMIDGPLRQKVVELGITVVLDVNLQIETMKDADWTQGFSLVFCNAINFCVYLSERYPNTPIIWWLHDSAFFYDGIDKDMLFRLDRRNLTVCAVGPVPAQVIQSFVPDLPVTNLLYGVADCCKCTDKVEKDCDRICFVTIGYVEERKGQDILVKAVKCLPIEQKKKAVFYLVGQNTSTMAQRLKAKLNRIPEIRLLGTVDRNQINKILDRADVMICPSREDPMPTVAAEAMMHSVPCIVSDVTGTAAYISDGVDGLVFRSEDEYDLSLQIKWCIENHDKLCGMGVRARQIYNNYFSMEVFEQNLLNIVNQEVR
ncbi:MAG: glycosyltransferase family 4 protein [Lachnospiraceae bacterium]|nr:glycosyltransferase family 4 protein [Lachnospiraceae bacterium]